MRSWLNLVMRSAKRPRAPARFRLGSPAMSLRKQKNNCSQKVLIEAHSGPGRLSFGCFTSDHRSTLHGQGKPESAVRLLFGCLDPHHVLGQCSSLNEEL